ncbi:MAG: hypothetical protein WCO13_00635 [Bacteroidota bacterium]
MKKIFIFLLAGFLFSCSTTKFKEKTKEVYKIDSIYIDTSRTTITGLQQQIKELTKKNFTIYQKDTIIKIDSFYFRIPIKISSYTLIESKEENKVVKIEDMKKGRSYTVKKDIVKEKEVKNKKIFNYFILFILFIPVFLILIIFILWKYWLKIKPF